MFRVFVSRLDKQKVALRGDFLLGDAAEGKGEGFIVVVVRVNVGGLKVQES